MVYPAVNNLDNPNQIIFTNMEFYNFIYNFYSLIGVHLYGGKIEITDCIFQRFGSCGAIISNNYPLYNPNSEAVDCSHDKCSDYNTGGNQAFFPFFEEELKQYHKANLGLNPLYEFEKVPTENKFSNCLLDDLNNPCFDIQIKQSTFEQMTFKTESVSSPVKRGSDGLAHRGSILALKSFLGDIRIEDSSFLNNKINQNTCYDETYCFTNEDGYYIYDFYGKRTKSQVHSMISITNHKFDILFIKNTFTQNTGSKGPIYIERTQEQG